MGDQADSEGTPGIPVLRSMGPDESVLRLQSMGSAPENDTPISAAEPTEVHDLSTASPYQPLSEGTPSAVPTSQTTMLFQPSAPRTSIQDHALGEFQFGTVDAELISTPSTSSAESAVVPLPAPLSPMNVPPAHTVEASVDARKNVQRHPAWETGYWFQQGDIQDDARLVGAPMETSTRGSSLLPDVRRETLAPRFGSGATVETSAIPSVPSHQNLLSGHVAANVGPSDATGPFATPRSGPSELRGPTRWLPGDILIARFATHDLVERGGVRLAVLRDVTHVEGPTERPAGNTLAPAGSTSIDTSSMDRHFAEEHARLRENHRQHFDPTTEEFMESLYGPLLVAMTPEQYRSAWYKCDVLRRQQVAATVSDHIYRVPRPRSEQMATSVHAHLFEGRHADASYRHVSTPMPYDSLKRQSYAESRMDQSGRFSPLAGTGNACSPVQGGLLRPGYQPSPVELRQLAEQASTAVAASMRPVFTVGDANKVLGRHKGTFNGWQTVDPRGSGFDQVSDIEKFVNSLRSKDVFVYVAAMLIGKIVLKYDDYDRLSHEARKVVDAGARIRSQLSRGDRVLAAPTLFAEILNSFEKQCPNTYYDCNAELAGCIDNRLRGEMWEQSSATIKQSIFGSTGENTFVECVVLWLNAPFVRYNPADCVKQLEQLVRKPKPVAMAPDEFHRLFLRRLEQYRYANQGHSMFPSEQKTMACLVEAYGNYDHYKSLFQTMETLCRLQNTVAPWQPDSTYTWTVQDLMLHIEKHRDEKLDFNPLVQAPTGSANAKSINAVGLTFAEFKKQWSQSRPSGGAGSNSGSTSKPEESDSEKKAKDQERRKAQMLKNIGNRVDADGKCKFCKKPMPPCGPGTGTAAECVKCKQCARSCQHTADRCPYHKKGPYFGKFENGETSRPWNVGHTCPKCKSKHDHDPADCDGTKHEESILLQKKLLANNSGFKRTASSSVSFKVNNVQATNQDTEDPEVTAAWEAFSTIAKDSKIVGGLLKVESLAKILCAQTTEDFQTALNSLVLFDPGAEVSMHTSPTNSVGKLVPKPNVTLSGVFGGESGQQQGCCAQRLDTKDHEGKIVSLNVPESYYCPTARVNILSGADWKKGLNHFVDCGTDVFMEVAGKRIRIPADMPVLIRNDSVVIPLHRIIGSELLWIKLLQGDAAPVVKPQLGVIPASPKIQPLEAAVVAHVCAKASKNWPESEVAYYLEQFCDSEGTDAAATHFERDGEVPAGPNSREAVKLVAALAQRHTADLAGIPDLELVEQAGPVLKFCEKFMPTLAGIGPEVWLHDLLEPGQQAYLCRCALAVLKHTEMCPEANCALEAFHVAVRNVSTDAANLLQLVSGELLSELRAGKLI